MIHLVLSQMTKKDGFLKKIFGGKKDERKRKDTDRSVHSKSPVISKDSSLINKDTLSI
jgi:hypothetical protein